MMNGRFSTALFGAALALGLAQPASAADLLGNPKPVEVAAAPAPWEFDLAFGAKLMSDYNFRGISQSNRKPSGAAYLEARYGWLYAGVAVNYVKLPTDPAAEVDFTAGIRPVIGPVTFDIGVIYYYYPSERQLVTLPGPVIWTPANTDFWEIYGKASWDVTDIVNVGANIYYSPNWLHTGATGTYISGTAKVKLPHDFAISGELGRYFLGTTDFYLGALNLKDYTYWNVGLSYTWNWLTLDLRYHDTTLSKSDCFLLTSDPSGIFNGTGRSKWCGAAFIASASVDFTWSQLTKK